MKKIFYLIVCFAIFYCNLIEAQISGTVFRDYNANGAKDNTAAFNEPFLQGITVKVYDLSNTEVAAIISDANGYYSFPTLTAFPYRVEFSGYATGDYSSPAGIDNNSSVQFYSAATTTANFGVSYPWDYAQSNPTVVTPRYIQGYQLSGATADLDVLLKFGFNSTGDQDQPTYVYPNGLTQANAIGATYGLAYHRRTSSLFAGAFLKYATGFGPGGPGAIYKIDTLGNASTFMILNAGTDPHFNETDFILVPGTPPPAPAEEIASVAPITKNLVSKMSLGDVDLDEETNMLYVMNLFDKKLYQIPIGTTATAPPMASVFSAQIPTTLSTGTDVIINDDLRPFGIGINRGRVFVGVQGTAESSQNFNQLWIWVLEYDPNSHTFLPTPVVSIPFTYQYEHSPGNFQPHSVAWSSTTGLQSQQIITDIAFDGNEMIIATRDRFEDMNDYTANGANGDILRLCPDAALTTWNLVSYGNCGASPGGSQTLYNDDPTPLGEYYNDYSLDFPINELAMGALLQIPGKPLMGTGQDVGTHFLAAGIIRFDNTTGANVGDYEVYVNKSSGGSGISNIYYDFGKGTGLGDIEAFSALPPLEIGNRVWEDSNTNGIQDAGEAGIANVTFELYAADGTTLLGTTTSNANGAWYFNNLNVNLNGATGLLPNTNYIIRVAATDWAAGTGIADLNGLLLTTPNNDPTTNGDIRDNDALLVSGKPEISYTTSDYGQNNHTLDMGFRAVTNPDITLTKTVNTSEVADTITSNQVTFTITVTNEGTATAFGVQVTDLLPATMQYVSHSAPINPYHLISFQTTYNNTTGIWNIDSLPVDGTLSLTITAKILNSGIHYNSAEVTSQNGGTDIDSTPNNNTAGEDDQDQVCVTAPVYLCSGSTTAAIEIGGEAGFASYQWYSSLDGITYTAITDSTNSYLNVNNALMGTNTKMYFKLAYNGADIYGNCGEVMCCPVIVKKEVCCITQDCIPLKIRKVR